MRLRTPPNRTECYARQSTHILLRRSEPRTNPHDGGTTNESNYKGAKLGVAAATIIAMSSHDA